VSGFWLWTGLHRSDWIEDALLNSATQEHGIITLNVKDTGEIATCFPVGSRLRILPNHACATGAQFPNYYAVDADGELKFWSRIYGWYVKSLQAQRPSARSLRFVGAK